jgi:hypothetical protein
MDGLRATPRHSIIISSLMPIINKMGNDVRFDSKRESDY